MRKTLSVAYLLILIIAVACTSGNRFAWLGPQSTSMANKLIAQLERQEITSTYEIRIAAIKGRELSFEQSGNSIVTFNGKTLIGTEEGVIEPEATYLYGRLKLLKQYGQRIYTCDVRLEEGPLQGAIVHLRDGILPESIGDAYQCYYRVPDELGVPEGNIKAKVIGWSAK